MRDTIQVSKSVHSMLLWSTRKVFLKYYTVYSLYYGPLGYDHSPVKATKKSPTFFLLRLCYLNPSFTAKNWLAEEALEDLTSLSRMGYIKCSNRQQLIYTRWVRVMFALSLNSSRLSIFLCLPVMSPWVSQISLHSDWWGGGLKKRFTVFLKFRNFSVCPCSKRYPQRANHP